MGAMLLALLLATAYSLNQIVTVTDSTNLTAMNKTCMSSPVSNLNLCNNTCLECTSSSSYKCSSCNSEFMLDIDACVLDNSIHTYTYYSYLNALNTDIMISDLSNFIYTDTGVNVGPNKVLEICKSSTYEMFMAGPFKDTNFVGINYQYTDSIDQMQIKFNFMSLVQDCTLYIEFNGQVVFQNKYNIFSDLVGTYGKNPNNSGPNYLFLDALTSADVQSVVTPVDTGLLSIISNSISIRIYMTTSSPGYCWGFNDFVVIQRACETCPTKAVVDLLNQLGTLCYAVALVVIGLILLLFLMIKLDALKSRMEKEAKLGTSDSLPIKAIDRVMDSLQRSVKTMRKEFRREDKKHDKALTGLKTIIKRQ